MWLDTLIAPIVVGEKSITSVVVGMFDHLRQGSAQPTDRRDALPVKRSKLSSDAGGAATSSACGLRSHAIAHAIHRITHPSPCYAAAGRVPFDPTRDKVTG